MDLLCEKNYTFRDDSTRGCASWQTTTPSPANNASMPDVRVLLSETAPLLIEWLQRQRNVLLIVRWRVLWMCLCRGILGNVRRNHTVCDSSSLWYFTSILSLMSAAWQSAGAESDSATKLGPRFWGFFLRLFALLRFLYSDFWMYFWIFVKVAEIVLLGSCLYFWILVPDSLENQPKSRAISCMRQENRYFQGNEPVFSILQCACYFCCSAQHAQLRSVIAVGNYTGRRRRNYKFSVCDTKNRNVRWDIETCKGTFHFWRVFWGMLTWQKWNIRRQRTLLHWRCLKSVSNSDKRQQKNRHTKNRIEKCECNRKTAILSKITTFVHCYYIHPNLKSGVI